MRDNSSQEQLDSSNSSNNRGFAKNNDLIEVNNTLKTNDVEFFDSFYENFININFSIVSIKRYIFYRDIYTFKN